jgi:hypothetical protein
MPRVDLHTHSTASDGTVTPAGIVREAERVGLAAVALTDHDTVQGLPEFLAAGRNSRVKTVPGCELSVDSRIGSMHIVALWLGERPGLLVEALEELERKRLRRNEAMIDKLQKLGVAVELDEVRRRAQGTVGRPHMAQLMVEKGFARDLDDAFDRYLGANGAAYVPRAKLEAESALELLEREGATSILAHPGLVRASRDALAAELVRLQKHGLRGMEVFYCEHDPARAQAMASLADRLGLLYSGGSDFHGEVKPEIQLGKGRGGLHVDASVLEALELDRIKRGLWI